MYEPIIDALRRGATDEALIAARTAVAEQPQDAAAHRLLANALRLAGDRDAAIAAIDQAIELAPEDADLHLERAGLMLHERKLDEAQASLARSIGLDPNQFPAYIVQAQLALGRGDLDEAERLTRTAARIAPEHPQIAALEGTLALRRGDADRALAMLNAALQVWPDEPALRHALGFAYLAKGHLAFAEQLFRGLLENQPDSLPLRVLIANIVQQQGRPDEAVDELAPLLAGDNASPGLRRMIGQLELEAGRDDSALEHLKQALQARPEDRPTILAICEAWRRLGAEDDARSTLDAMLSAHPQHLDIWRARLLFEEFASDAAGTVVTRWLQAMPECVQALEAQITLYDVAGKIDEADALAVRVTELQPGHAGAEMRVLGRLLERDPEEAVEHVERLLVKLPQEPWRSNLRRLLGIALLAAGHPTAAAATWTEFHAEIASLRLPLIEHSAVSDWPPAAVLEPSAQPALLLWGAPGSLVERIARSLLAAGAPLYQDRFGPTPPDDLFQRYQTIGSLSSGSANPADLISEWKAALPGRGLTEGQIFDWLPWWDNALLLAVRPHLPQAMLAIVLRDPRDMLLDWIAFGSPVPFALESPEVAARWLARALEQLAELHENELMPHCLMRMDGIENDPAAIAQLIANALQIDVADAPVGVFGPDRLESGRWREFVEPLGAAFALLTPVALRLGYPQD
ncbi:MAG: tetratricopeptide repeat protein [Lysobacter sp.]